MSERQQSQPSKAPSAAELHTRLERLQAEFEAYRQTHTAQLAQLAGALDEVRASCARQANALATEAERILDLARRRRVNGVIHAFRMESPQDLLPFGTEAAARPKLDEVDCMDAAEVRARLRDLGEEAEDIDLPLLRAILRATLAGPVHQ